MRPSSEIVAELERLYAQHGELTPRIVVDAAREEDSPLHSQFEWDFELAAEHWLLEQASHLIRRARIRIVSAPEMPPLNVRAFISQQTEDKRHVYRPYRIVTADAAMRQQALDDMERDWKALRRKWETYTEFWLLVQKDLPPKRRRRAG